MNDEIILSILIPTYNRCKHLDKALSTIFSQLSMEFCPIIEILVSDNCSNDETQLVLTKHENSINSNIKFFYWMNVENIGPDANFTLLAKKAKGKFCWIFGDDEYLLMNGLAMLIEILKDNIGAGVVHLSNRNNGIREKRYYNPNKYMKEVNYYISFITGNVFKRELVNWMIEYENYFNSFLIQEYFFLQAILTSNYNVYVSRKIFATESAENIGGFKLFEVFGYNQNEIFEYFTEYGLSKGVIAHINKSMLRCHFPIWIMYIKGDKNKQNWEYEELSSIFKIYKDYASFWIFCYPLITLPTKFAKVYFFLVRGFNKMFRIFDYIKNKL